MQPLQRVLFFKGSINSFEIGSKITASSGATCGFTSGSSGIGNGPVSISGQFSYFENNHQATDANGNHAELHAKVTNGQDLTYNNAVVPAKGQTDLTYALAQQSLSVGQSASIQCSQSASDSAGNKASSGTTIYNGLLESYSGWAGAGNLIPDPKKGIGVYTGIIGTDVQHAEAGQSFDLAVGNSIDVQEKASNNVGYTASSTTTALGTSSDPAAIEGYYGQSGAGTNAMLGEDANEYAPSDAKVVFAFRALEGAAYGSTVTIEDSASNKLISAKAKTTVTNGGILSIPFFVPFTALAMASYTSTETTPTVYKYGDVFAGSLELAGGDNINIEASAQQVQNQNNQGNDNNQGNLNRASVKATLQNGEYEGVNAAATEGSTAIIAAQYSYYGLDGSRITYGATATSTSGAHAVFGPITELNPTGLENEAGVNLATGQVFAGGPI